MLEAFFILVLLIAMNSLYVAGEFAFVAARTTFVQQQVREGSQLAKRLLAVLESQTELDDSIATCQIGITLSSLILGAYTQLAFGPSWSKALTEIGVDSTSAQVVSAILILLTFTLIQILFGELLPKSIALSSPNKVAMIMYWPLRLSASFFRPFIWLLNGSGNFFLKLIGVKATSHKHIHSLDEIGMLLNESLEGGVLEPEKHSRLDHALALAEQTATHLMTPRTRLISVSVNSDIDEIYDIAKDSPFTRIIAYGESIDDVLGFINVRDIIRARITGQKEEVASMVKEAPIIPENLHMEQLIALLRERHSQLAIVVDEHGATLGIVTVGDLLSELMDRAEIDEFKKPEEVTILEDESIRLPGSFKLHRAMKILGAIPECEADTINGLIMHVLGRVPKEGDLIELENVVLSIEAVEHHSASKILLTRKEVK